MQTHVDTQFPRRAGFYSVFKVLPLRRGTVNFLTNPSIALILQIAMGSVYEESQPIQKRLYKVNDMVELRLINDTIAKYYGADGIGQPMSSSKKKQLRTKLVFLLMNVLTRDKKKYKATDGRTASVLIPDEDVPVITALLVRSVSDEPADKLICDWFNDNCDITDLELNMLLFDDISNMLKEMMKTPNEYMGLKYVNGIEMRDDTKQRWLSYFRYALNYDVAKFKIDFPQRFEDVYEGLFCLRPPASLSQMYKAFQMLGDKGEAADDDDPYESPFILLSFDKQTEYLDRIKAFMDEYELDIKKDIVEYFIVYIHMKQAHNWHNITESVGHTPLTSSELNHFQRLYGMIQKDPDIITQLQRITGEQDLIEFFRVKPT